MVLILLAPNIQKKLKGSLDLLHWLLRHFKLALAISSIIYTHLQIERGKAPLLQLCL